ncbi:MAG: trimeric intracellular cation channel family protein [Celeribacter sp.]|jgi:uncharacterized membrane protein YeiH
MELITSQLWFDLLGTFVFGISGGMLAVRRELDLFGVMVLSLAAALAGGVLRDVALGDTPPAALRDARYLLAALAAGLCAFVFHRGIERLAKPVMVFDAAGLGLFAVSGCQKALTMGVAPLPAVLLGVLTAVGGGALRDLLVTEVPRVLREDIYALAALAGAVVVASGAWLGLPPAPVALLGVGLTFALRVISVWRGWRAPKAPGS